MGATRMTADEDDAFFACAEPALPTLSVHIGLLRRLASSTPLAWVRFWIAVWWRLLWWPWLCSSCFSRCPTRWELWISLVKIFADAGDRHLHLVSLQAFIDLASIAPQRAVRVLAGRGVSECPPSELVVPLASELAGRGAWLYRRGTGRCADTLPPRPSDPGGDKLILYIHGGAFFACGTSTHYFLATELVRRTGAVVLQPAYPRSPEHRFPAALRGLCALYEQCVARCARSIACVSVSVAGPPSQPSAFARAAGTSRGTCCSSATRPAPTSSSAWRSTPRRAGCRCRRASASSRRGST
jgi:hypothetical protein